jgi:hypothetical protein
VINSGSSLCIKNELIWKCHHKSAGTEGIDFVPPASSWNDFGRYEIALLFLGVMHFQFGHPKQALEVSMRKAFPFQKNPLFHFLYYL